MQRIDVAYVAAWGVLAAAAIVVASAPSSAVPARHPQQGSYACEVRGEVQVMRRAAGARWMVRLRQANGQVVQAFVTRALLPGDVAALRGQCAPPPGYLTPGSATPSQRAARGGFDLALGGAVVAHHQSGAQPHWRRGFARLGEAVYATIARHTTNAEARGLLLGLTLGTTAELAEADQQIWRDLGTVHALSVSGLHLTVVALCAYALLSRLALLGWLSPRRGLWLAQLGTGVAVLLYAGVTGFQVATVRALLMALAVLVAAAAGRAADGWRILIIALGIMVAFEPRWLADPSFQLSASATAALMAAAPWFIDESPVPRQVSWWRRAGGGLAKALAVSAWVTICTAPLVAYHFHQVAPASPLANLLVTMTCEVVALPLAMLGVSLAPVSDAVAGACLSLAQAAAAVSLATARWLGGWLPAIECAPPSGWALACYAAACVATWRALRTRQRQWWLAALAALALALGWPHAPAAPLARDSMRVTFIDVGQGDAALLEFPGGARWLIDAGAEAGQAGAAYDPLLRYLRARRITKLDRVVVSHRHADHFAALCNLVGRIEVVALWRTMAPMPTPTQVPALGATGQPPADARAFARCAQALQARGTQVEAPRLGRFAAAALGGATVDVIGPAWFAAEASGVRADDVRGENDNSLVLLVAFAGRRIAFLGDAEAELEAALMARLGPVDVVKVGHHGSRTSSTQALVQTLRPAVAIVSVGRRNHFGLPSREALVRWEHAGARLLRTDVHGTVSVTIAHTGAWRWFTYLRGVVALP